MAEALLDGIVVLDMAQFLSGPLAALRLADLGARVIKVERPAGGDLCRNIYLDRTEVGGTSSLFQTINRNKEGFTADLKDPRDLARLRRLIAKADVLIQNFRPGVIEKLGLSYEALSSLNPRLVYASVSGYGSGGPWVDRPGQDLLAQARSGVMWLSGDRTQGPVPMGVSIADMLAGHTLAQGILAALVRRGRTGGGARIETSLLEVLLDMQFESLTLFLKREETPERSAEFNANAYLPAPYGVYPTQDGHIAIAMTPVGRLYELLGIDAPPTHTATTDAAFVHRDAIKSTLATHLRSQATAAWLAVLEPADIWCAEVLDWPRLLASDGLAQLDMLQSIENAAGASWKTTRPPLTIDCKRPNSKRGAPRLGEHTRSIATEFGLE